jgi:hypothetical protein
MIVRARVGVLMDSLRCPRYLLDTLTRLAADQNVELHLLQNAPHRLTGLARVREKIRQVGLLRFSSIVFFTTIEYLEQKAFSAMIPGVRRHFEEVDLDPAMFASSTLLTPAFSRSRISVIYPDDDVERIRGLQLDLILRGTGTGIYRGSILTAATNGIISFHHGDNRWNRGGPPGFWEVFFKRAATGFIIQILTEQLDGGDVIFRGEAPTKRSYTENMVNLFDVANPFMARIISDYAATKRLPPVLPRAPFSTGLLKTPKFSVTVRYVARMVLLFLALVTKRKVLGRHLRWSVGFVPSDWKEANLAKGCVIRNPRGRFLADPFVARREAQTAIFVEDYHYSSRKGVISAVRVLPDGAYEIIPGVLEEDFHLSFPYLFEYAGELYMVPESHESQSIRLYKCMRFPDKWEYQMDLMAGVSAVDTMVFEHAGAWWLLTNIAPENSQEHGSALYAFRADTPLSARWQEHVANPVQFSATFGRNGGLLKGRHGETYRVRQRYGYAKYGVGASIAKIAQLDEHVYREEVYCEIEPHFMSGLVGTHHLHSDGTHTVFDFVREETLK